MRPGFDRWTLGWGRTAAYNLFQAHHTELNSLYWSHEPAKRFAFAATRPLTGDEHTNALFPIPPEHERRTNHNLRLWAENFSAFDNWVRLNAVVAATGYLEVYLKTVIRLALESDPGVTIAAARAVDGISLLKRVTPYDAQAKVLGCVKGGWVKRLANYRRLFGAIPPVVQRSIEPLDRLRVLRNGVTHTFGRSTDDYDSILESKPKPFAKVSLEKLQRWLGLISEVAEAVDAHLGPTHIGEYEALYFYHHWDKRYNPDTEREDQALADRLRGVHGSRRGPEYYRDLITYYRGV